MKTYCYSLALVAAAGCLVLPLHAADSTGYVDFGRFSPPKSGGQFVEVNIRDNLIGMVARLAAAQEPEVAELLGGLKRIRVNVIGLDDDNRSEIGDRVGKLATELSDQGWERIVTARTGKDDVNVFLKMRDQEAVEGIVVTILQDNSEAVLINVVGDIRPEQIATLGERFDIEPLKKAGRAIDKS
jgi:hypothetical protein